MLSAPTVQETDKQVNSGSVGEAVRFVRAGLALGR
jgi:hypothetical protein